jgi:hypothetical protein
MLASAWSMTIDGRRFVQARFQISVETRLDDVGPGCARITTRYRRDPRGQFSLVGDLVGEIVRFRISDHEARIAPDARSALTHDSGFVKPSKPAEIARINAETQRSAAGLLIAREPADLRSSPECHRDEGNARLANASAPMILSSAAR